MQLWQSGFWFIFLVFFFVIVHLADFVCVVGAFCFVLFCVALSNGLLGVFVTVDTF